LQIIYGHHPFKLPTNTQGRDYVIGDLHGCTDLLDKLLAAVEFDKSKDRLFSVGDLIDRGPDSLSCLELLLEPWFFAVMGNHELMLLECFLPYLECSKLTSLAEIRESDHFKSGGDWVLAHYLPEHARMTEEFNRCLHKVVAMPLIIVVGEGASRFNIVHAELVRPNYRMGGQAVWLDSDLDRWLEEKTIPDDTYERLLWGRLLSYSNRFAKKKFESVQTGLSTTFCGHTPLPSPCQILSHLCLDTGAYFTLDNDIDDEWSGLTLFDIRFNNWLTASYRHEKVFYGDFVLNHDPFMSRLNSGFPAIDQLTIELKNMINISSTRQLSPKLKG
jgi:serine/threonine protein phosphatase 1